MKSSLKVISTMVPSKFSAQHEDGKFAIQMLFGMILFNPKNRARTLLIRINPPVVGFVIPGLY